MTDSSDDKRRNDSSDGGDAPDSTPGGGGRDPGLQPERTRLAWRRTTLAFTVAAVLAGRQALIGDTSTAGSVAAVFSGLVWLAFLWVAHHRVRILGAGRRPSTLGHPTALAATVCTVALAVFAVTMIF